MAQVAPSDSVVTPPDNGKLRIQTTTMDVTADHDINLNDTPNRTPRPAAAVPAFPKTTSVSPRKQSVLTQLLHSSEAESTEETSVAPIPRRGLSAISTWSNPSLTSDGMTSPDTRASTPSPPLPASVLQTSIPEIIFNHKSFSLKPTTINDAHDSIDPLQTPTIVKPASEETVEAGLGRKRCITFACGKKDAAKEVKQPEPKVEAAPAPRKCMLRFVCPSRAAAQQEVERPTQSRRLSDGRKPSPAPPALKLSPRSSQRLRRSSTSPRPPASPKSPLRSRLSIQARRFRNTEEVDTTSTERACGYAGQRAEDDDWMKERTCHRSRLTVDDTLRVEKNLRHLAEEAEEEEEDEIEAEEELDREGLPSDEEDADDDDDDDEDADADSNNADSEEAEDDIDSGFGTDFTARVVDLSDDGFHSDDEGGMGDSSDDSDAESEFSWWAPGKSTAATSYEHLDSLHFTRQRNMSGSSIDSVSSVRAISGERPDMETIKKTRKRRAIPIRTRVELPDSTDFVCGTLDEDRPLEEAYAQEIKERRAAKHRVCPQDIDPTFPTSDPDMDEEDDEDIYVNHHESDEEAAGIFGELEEHKEPVGRASSRTRQRPAKSPAPSPKRARSPRRARSPAPKRLQSPAPKRRHSPPPPLSRRSTSHRSPPPAAKLFGSSPRRFHSPPPTARLRSPPPSRRASVAKFPNRASDTSIPQVGLAARPHGATIYSTSLPRRPNLLQRHRTFSPIPDVDNESGDDEGQQRVLLPSRGAIDIVKGLEKKRQLRKEKLHQKMCRQKAAQAEKGKEEKKCLMPGKGAERMREMGLELAGKWKKGDSKSYGPAAQHILSL